MSTRLFSPVAFWPLLVCLILSAAGCAGAGNERLDAMETSLGELKGQEIRLALLEDRVNALSGELAALKDSSTAREAVSPQTKKGARPASGAAPAAASEAPLAAPAKSGPQSAGEKSYQKALTAFEAGKTETARDLFTAFLKDNPASSLTPNAGYWLGECYYSLKRYDTAIITFKDVVAKYPRHPKAAASMLKAGFAYARLGDKDNAKFYLETLVHDFPDSQPAKLARQRLSSL